MAFLDKAKELANQAIDKGEDAVNAGKLMLKIKDEEKTLKDLEAQIGHLIVAQLDGGADFGEEVKAVYTKFTASRTRLEELKEEQEKNGEE